MLLGSITDMLIVLYINYSPLVKGIVSLNMIAIWDCSQGY